MTTIIAACLPADASAGPDLAAQVRAAHARWRADVRAALHPATTAEATYWDRARAVRDLETRFMPVLQRERRAIAVMGPGLRPEEVRSLWALGELLALLHARLTDLVVYPQSGAIFAAAAEKLARGLDDWCERVEEAASPGEAVPPEVRRLLTGSSDNSSAKPPITETP